MGFVPKRVVVGKDFAAFDEASLVDASIAPDVVDFVCKSSVNDGRFEYCPASMEHDKVTEDFSNMFVCAFLNVVVACVDELGRIAEVVEVVVIHVDERRVGVSTVAGAWADFEEVVEEVFVFVSGDKLAVAASFGVEFSAAFR